MLTYEQIDIETRQIVTLALFSGVKRDHEVDLITAVCNFGRTACDAPLAFALFSLDRLLADLEAWGLDADKQKVMRSRLLRFGYQFVIASHARASS